MDYICKKLAHFKGYLKNTLLIKEFLPSGV